MPTSNTHECWSEFVGQKVIGCLFDALPTSRRDIASGTHALIFEDGRALVVSGSGTYWVENAEEVRRAIRYAKRDLDATSEQIKGILTLAGALDG